MIAIGENLRRRGYEVHISIAEPYQELAQSCGLQTNVVVDSRRFDELLSDRLVWKPFRGVRRIMAWACGEFAPRHLQWIQDHYVPGQTILVSHPLDFASRIFREFVDVPLIDIHLAPSMLRTYQDPPQMTASRWECRRPAWLVRFAYRCVDRFAIDPVSAKPINRLRMQCRDWAGGGQSATSTSAGSPTTSVRRIMDQWWLSPDQILAMYPQWFAPAVSQDFDVVSHCGFPLRDDFEPDHAEQSDDQESNQHGILENQTIVFTTGTAHRHGHAFFEAAIQACEKLGRRGLLLTKHRDNLPRELPPSISTASYLPLSRTLPAAAAMVHHGGIGTTSAAIAAGCPQLICPMAFDQFDNGRHVERLGVGKVLSTGDSTDPQMLAKSLACLLDDPRYKTSAKTHATLIAQHGDAVDKAAEMIDKRLFQESGEQPRLTRKCDTDR